MNKTALACAALAVFCISFLNALSVTLRESTALVSGIETNASVSGVSLNGTEPLTWAVHDDGVIIELPVICMKHDNYSVDIIMSDQKGSQKILTVALDGFIPALAMEPFFKQYRKGQPNPFVFTTSPKLESFKILRDGHELPVFRMSDERSVAFIPSAILSENKEVVVDITAVKGGVRYGWKRTFNVEEGGFLKERIQLPVASVTSVKISEYVPKLVQYENEKVDALLSKQYPKMFRNTFFWPITGRITSPFGIMRAYNSGGFDNIHTGIDIGGNPAGTEIRAPNDGMIVLAEDFYARGNTVMIEHGCGLKTMYYHMMKFFVREGQIVRKGDLIGLIGTTGYSTGPHLHWEFRLNGVAVDPYFFMYNDIDTGKVYGTNTRN